MDGSGQYYDAAAGEQARPAPSRLVSISGPGNLITEFRLQEQHTYMHAFLPGGNGDGHDDGSPAYRAGGFGAVPASEEAIAGLEEAAVEETREAECAVCLVSFEVVGDKIRKMPCSHAYHEDCIFTWLRISRVCPLCRFPVSAADDH